MIEIVLITPLILGFIPLILMIRRSVKNFIDKRRVYRKYYKGNIRDIPCNKDILKIYYISITKNIVFNKFNIINAYILKWIYNKNISIIDKNKVLMKESPEEEIEKQLYNLLSKCSINDVLRFSNVNSYMKKNYYEFELWYQMFWASIETRYYDEITDEDISNIVGLKEFLKHFSSFDAAEIKNIHQWEAYLLCAAIFGITKNIMKQTDSVNLFELALVNPYMQSKQDYNLIKKLMNLASKIIDSAIENDDENY